MKKLFLSGCILVLFCSCLNIQAQSRKYNGTRRRSINDNFYGIWKLTAGAGIASYKGDIGGSPSAKIRPIRPDLYVGVQYRLTSHWSLKSELGWYQIAANDAKGQNPQRNLSFRSNNIEAYVAGMYDIFRFTRRYSRVAPTPFNPYLFAGIGFTTVNPQAKYSDGTWYSLRPLHTEGKSYSSVALTIPLGFGVRYRFNRLFDISLEASYRITTTDYLDDVSTKYNLDAINSGGTRGYFANIGAPDLTSDSPDFQYKRGDPSKKDGYFVVGLKLEYSTVPSANYGGSSSKQKGYKRRRR